MAMLLDRLPRNSFAAHAQELYTPPRCWAEIRKLPTVMCCMRLDARVVWFLR
jgi:hypothetical protein